MNDVRRENGPIIKIGDACFHVAGLTAHRARTYESGFSRSGSGVPSSSHSPVLQPCTRGYRSPETLRDIRRTSALNLSTQLSRRSLTGHAELRADCRSLGPSDPATRIAPAGRLALDRSPCTFVNAAQWLLVSSSLSTIVESERAGPIACAIWRAIGRRPMTPERVKKQEPRFPRSAQYLTICKSASKSTAGVEQQRALNTHAQAIPRNRSPGPTFLQRFLS